MPSTFLASARTRIVVTTQVKTAVVVTLASAALGISCLPLHATPREPTRSVWDGVYTEEQATRGEPLYLKLCAKCHGSDLMGGITAPPLMGREFRSSWDSATIGALFDRTLQSMPQDNPETLTRQETADLTAFILREGDFPAGPTELPTQSEALNEIMYRSSSP